MSTRTRFFSGLAALNAIVVICVFLTAAAHPAGTPQATTATHWVGTWATAGVGRPSGGAPPVVNFNNQTLRQIAHTSVGGSQARVVFSNAFGTVPLVIGAGHVSLRDEGPEILPQSDRQLKFSGAASITIPPGAIIFSDPVELAIPPLTDIAIDVYFPGNTGTMTSPLTMHGNGLETNYVSSAGNYAGMPAFPVETTTQSWFLLARLEVAASEGVKAIVALGDSITDGTRSTPDSNSRWPDNLARRLLTQKAPMQMGVLNVGIAGNRLLADGIPSPTYNAGINALARFDDDVIAQSAAAYVVVLEGINDIRGFAGIGIPRQNPVPTPDQLIAAYRQLITRAHTHGLKIYGSTLTPFGGSAGWTAEDEMSRQAVNQWIRTGKAYDGVIDFDAAVRDPKEPTKILAEYDSGDHLHPSDSGYRRMAEAIDLSLFTENRR